MISIYQKVNDLEKKQDSLNEVLKTKRFITKPNEMIYDNADLMQLFKVSQRTLANWRANGIITYSKIGGKILYTQADIDACMDSNKFKFFNNGINKRI